MPTTRPACRASERPMVPRAAVGVHDELPARERAERRRLRVEPLGLRRVDLVKGEGREAEAQAAELVLQVPVAEEGQAPAAQDLLRGAGVDVLHRAAQRGDRGLQGVAQGLLCRQRGGGGHERRQRLAPAVGAHNEVPHEPAPRPLVIGGDAVGAHPGQHGPRRGAGRLALQRAVLRGDEVVRAAAHKAQVWVLRRAARAEGRLVAVAPGVFHAENRQEVERLRPAHARKKPGDLGLQRGKVRGVVHELHGAPAAPAVERAARRRAPGRGVQHAHGARPAQSGAAPL